MGSAHQMTESDFRRELLDRLSKLESRLTDMQIEVAQLRGAISFVKWAGPITVAVIAAATKFL